MITASNNLEFHVSNKYLSYVFRVMEKTNILEHLYFGEKIHKYSNYDFLIEREVRTGNNFIEGDYTSSFEHIKQEMPFYGTTDFRYPAIEIEYGEGDTISHFEYYSHRIEKGKEKIKGFPQSFGNVLAVERLIITLKDRYSNLYLEMEYGIYNDYPVITRKNRLINKGDSSIFIRQLMSLNLDIENDDFEWIHLDGAWARERHVKRHLVQPGVQNISSTRGASSHVYNPFMALVSAQTTEKTGKAIGVSLIYSGNFLAQVERDNFEILRVQMGINPYQFKWHLMPNQEFTTPEAVMVYSNEGLNGMSQTFHEFFKNHLIDPKWLQEQRPILINNWEATYFDFNEEKIINLAKKAKEVGIDLLVLDDGWFGSRNNDNGSLGNWTVDQNKLPNGISGLTKKINNIGLKFGLWIEPEMVSKDTELYQLHPEWRIGNLAKNVSHGRNQYVLNFGNPLVVDNIFNQLDAIISSANIEYIKWDMNRYISEAYSTYLGSANQGELFHRYILGVYDLYEKLIEKYPNILIESCAGGGGRFDPGMLYYSPQIWASDNTDAVERLKIQYGTSFVYPLSAIGSHVSEVPNHQVGRLTSIKMRSQVAMFGTYGFELDITRLSEVELATIKNEVLEFKKYQHLIHSGKFYRLLSPFESEITAWMVVSNDQKEALVGIYQPLAKPNDFYRRIKLAGLAVNKKYFFENNKRMHHRYGQDLQSIGILLGDNFIDRAQDYWSKEKQGDYYSQLIYLQSGEE